MSIRTLDINAALLAADRVETVAPPATPRPAGEGGGKPDAATRTALALRHVSYQDLGAFEEMLRARGFRVRYFDIGRGDLAARGAPRLEPALSRRRPRCASHGAGARRPG